MSSQAETTGKGRRSKRFDRAFCAILVVLMCATRIPFASRALYHYDSVVFAVAMDDYNPRPLGAPHPPGYIFYIGVAKLARMLFPQANDALVFVSILSELLTVVFLYRLCLEAFNRTYAVVSTLALLVSPLFWFHGEVALSYPIESFFGVLVALLLFRAAGGSKASLYLGAACMSIAGGFRTFATIMLLPLLIYVVLMHHRRVGRMFAVVAILIGCGLTWFIPGVIYGGGLAEHLNYSGQFWGRYLRATSIFYGASPLRSGKQLFLIAETCFSALWFFAPILLALCVKRLIQWYFAAAAAVGQSGMMGSIAAGARRIAAAAGRNDPFLFISIVIAPSVIFLWLLHFSQRGHISLFLPFLFIPVARAVEEFGSFRTERRRIEAVTAVCLVLNAAIFFAVKPDRTSVLTTLAKGGLVRHGLLRIQNHLNNWVLGSSRSAIVQNDELLQEFEDIRSRGDYTPQDTVFVTESDHRFANLFTPSYYQHVRYYMEDFTCYEIRIGGTMVPLSDPHIMVDKVSLTFTPDNWDIPQPVSVFAVPGTMEGIGVAAFKVWSPGMVPGSVVATKIDAAGQNLLVGPKFLSVPEGGVGTFQARLSREPSKVATVKVRKEVGGDPDLTADKTELVFTRADWDVPQTVAIRRSDSNRLLRGGANFRLTTEGVTGRVVTVMEAGDDPEDLIVTPTSLLVPDGGANLFTVRLAARPPLPVMVIVEKLPSGLFNELNVSRHHEQTLLVPMSAAARTVILPRGVRRIIWFIAPAILLMSTMEKVDMNALRLADGRQLVVSDLHEGESVFFAGYEFVRPRGDTERRAAERSPPLSAGP